VHVGRENQRDSEQREEIADDRALFVLRRIDRGNEAEPELLGNHGAGDLQSRDRQTPGEPEHGADDQLLKQNRNQRTERCEIDGVVIPVQGDQDAAEQQHDAEPHARRQVGLADARHQHDHGADAGKG
jgi:hypothetical protein